MSSDTHPAFLPERILYIDDEPLARSGLTRYAEANGLTVDVADDCPSALRMANQRPYAVIVADLRLPGPSGLEAILRLQQQLPDAIYILITGADLDIDASKLRRQGISHVIRKPWDPPKLIALLRQSLLDYTHRTETSAEFDTDETTFPEDYGADENTDVDPP